MLTNEEIEHLKEVYANRGRRVKQQIAEIHGKLILHQESFNKDTSNYSYIADLDRIEFLLTRINDFIKE